MDPKTAPPNAAPMTDPDEGAWLSEDKELFCTKSEHSVHSGHSRVVTDDDIVVEHLGQSVAIKVGIVDEFDEVDGLVLVVVVYGLELSPVIVGDEFAIAWSDVWIEQLHIAVVGDGVVQGQPLHPPQTSCPLRNTQQSNSSNGSTRVIIVDCRGEIWHM